MHTALTRSQEEALNLYLNLPVQDLDRSRAFFAALGFAFDPNFSDETALAMRVSDACGVMLLTHAKFAGFTPRPIADARKTTEALIAVQLDCREAVDAMFDKALAEGGEAPRDPEDHGFMYARAFADPDGHIWEPFWMDKAALAEMQKGGGAA